MPKRKAAVAAILYILKFCGGMGGRLPIRAALKSCAHVAQNNYKQKGETQCLRIRISGPRSKCSCAVFRITQNMISHSEAGRCAAVDPEGFAHSAAAEGEKSRAGDVRSKEGAKRRLTPMHVPASAVIRTYVLHVV